MALDRYLGDDEDVVLQTRKSRAVLLVPLLQALALLVVAFALALAPLAGGAGTVLDYLGAAVLVAALLRAGVAVLGWSLDRVVVTGHRIFEISGVLNRRVASMPLNKVNDLTYERGVLGRVLGYGDFYLESAGEHRGLDRLHMIPSPDAFYRTVTSVVAHGPPVRTDSESPTPNDDDDTGPIRRVVI